MDDKLATLLALGIHSDTGSLVFECTTPRDAAALHHCLLSGASQKARPQCAHFSCLKCFSETYHGAERSRAQGYKLGSGADAVQCVHACVRRLTNQKLGVF